jgi:hypothetical protein
MQAVEAAIECGVGSKLAITWRTGPRQSRVLHQMPNLRVAGGWLPAWTNGVARDPATI